MSVRSAAIQYVVHHQLSAGGMGTVHLGTMVSPAGVRPVALKRIHDHAATSARTQLSGQERLEALVAEAQLVFRLTHANICQVLDLAQSDDGTFMVMEFVDGLDLRTLLRGLGDDTPLDLGCAIYIAREIARALDYAHRRTDDQGRPLWLVHGDVKPQNVLLSREGEVKLADFGVARALGAIAPGNRLVGGTPGFIAPEAEDGRSDHRADIYSLGVTLAVALGADPRRGIDLPQLERGGAVPRQLIAILACATARRPEDRHSSAAALEQALSVPFSKIDPPFSPSTLARLVRLHAGPATLLSDLDHQREPTLVSLAPVAIKSAMPPDLSVTATTIPAPGSPDAGVRRTRPVAPSPRRAHRWLVVAAALALTGGGWWMVQDRSASSSRAAVAPVAAPRPEPAAGNAAAPQDANAPPVGPARPDSPTIAAPSARTSPGSAARKRTRSQRARAHDREQAGTGASHSEPGFLTVNAQPWGIVFVDGKRVAAETPAYRIALAPGKHRVHVFNPDRDAKSPVRTVHVRAGKTTTLGIRWK